MNCEETNKYCNKTKSNEDCHFICSIDFHWTTTHIIIRLRIKKKPCSPIEVLDEQDLRSCFETTTGFANKANARFLLSSSGTVFVSGPLVVGEELMLCERKNWCRRGIIEERLEMMSNLDEMSSECGLVGSEKSWDGIALSIIIFLKSEFRTTMMLIVGFY